MSLKTKKEIEKKNASEVEKAKKVLEKELEGRRSRSEKILNEAIARINKEENFKVVLSGQFVGSQMRAAIVLMPK